MDVSIVVPFYKGNKYINTVLKMVKENAAIAENISVELIIVNDSPEIAVCYDNDLVDGYQLTVVQHENNRGIQQARITGINAAQGKYILMLDQDDEIAPNTIKSQYDLIGDHAAVLSNGYSESVDKLRKKLYRSQKQLAVVNDFSYYFYFGNMIASPGLCLIRKDKIPSLWMTNVMQINGADDWLLWTLFLNEGNRFVLNNAFLYVHKNDGQNTSNNDRKMLDSSQEALDILRNKGITDTHLLRIYERRLRMRRAYLNGSKLDKAIQYLKNLDIFWRVLKYNRLMK